MTALYAIAVASGAIAIIAWVAMVAVAETVEGWEHIDPDRKFGSRGRVTVGAVTGFGIAGMSSSFAGWDTAPALLAALFAATVVGWLSARLWVGPDQGDG